MADPTRNAMPTTRPPSVLPYATPAEPDPHPRVRGEAPPPKRVLFAAAAVVLLVGIGAAVWFTTFSASARYESNARRLYEALVRVQQDFDSGVEPATARTHLAEARTIKALIEREGGTGATRRHSFFEFTMTIYSLQRAIDRRHDPGADAYESKAEADASLRDGLQSLDKGE